MKEKKKKKIKSSDDIDSDEGCPKIAKTSPESSPASSSSSTSVSAPAIKQQLHNKKIDVNKVKAEKADNDCWYQLEDGGEIKDLLPSGVIKNSSKLRFDVKEISLSDDL